MPAIRPVAACIGGIMGGMVALHAHAATDVETLIEEVKRLSQRVEQLETANRKLETVAGARAEAGEMAARIEDVENEVLALRKPSALEQALDGVSASASLIMVGQRASRGSARSEFSTRADVEVELPMGSIGDAEGRLFTHFRAGDGAGVASGAFATANATAFESTSPVLMQAWYQLDIPVGAATGKLGRAEVTVGKIDPFGFFDQNNIADDESEAFLNLAFVHNPLLDAGGDIGVGDHGASPGVRLAYIGDVNGGDNVTASLGLFGAGDGANFMDSFDKPLVIGQIEYAGKALAGMPGAYRLYAWSNGRAENFAGDRDRHNGWGVSLDQQVAGHLTLFGRAGLSTRGELAFDRAVTVGAQLNGGAWGRADDRIGLALGWLDTSKDYRQANPGFSGGEKHAELYYMWQLNEHLALTPDIQWIGRAAGDGSAKDVTVLGLRAKAAF